MTSSLNWDQHYGKTFRVVATPAGHSSDANGKQIPDEPGRFSIVTPENGEAWTDWPDAHPDQINMVKSNWDSFQKNLAGYKRDQIDRSYNMNATKKKGGK